MARKPTKKPIKSKRQRFTPEYKVEAVRLSEEATKSIAALAADLGIAANQLHRWRRQHADRGLAAFPGNGKINSPDEELHRLRRELRQVTEERDFPKKQRSSSLLREGVTLRYECIEEHAGEYRVAMMCSLLSASRSGCYAWRERKPSERAQKDSKLATQIRVIHKQSNETYGSPRTNAQLRHDGTRVGLKCVARVMRKERIDVRLRRRFRKSTDSRHGHPIAPNLLKRGFAIKSIRARDRVWASEITYIDTMEGWLYLAVVLDLRSRRVVGWSMSQRLESTIGLNALHMALSRGDSRERAFASFGSRQPIRGQAVPTATERSWYDVQHESKRRLLGQRGCGEL